jgi:hypothetical protein
MRTILTRLRRPALPAGGANSSSTLASTSAGPLRSWPSLVLDARTLGNRSSPPGLTCEHNRQQHGINGIVGATYQEGGCQHKSCQHSSCDSWWPVKVGPSCSSNPTWQSSALSARLSPGATRCWTPRTATKAQSRVGLELLLAVAIGGAAAAAARMNSRQTYKRWSILACNPRPEADFWLWFAGHNSALTCTCRDCSVTAAGVGWLQSHCPTAGC